MNNTVTHKKADHPFFENGIFPVLLVNTEGRIVQANNKAIEITGYTSLENLSIDTIFSMEKLDIKKPCEGECYFSNHGGDLHHCQYTYTHEGDFHTDGFVGCIVFNKTPDLLDQISQNSLFYETYHSNVIGMAILDEKFRIVDVNPSLCELLGYTARELIGKTSFESGLITEELVGDREEILKLLTSSRSITNLERRAKSKNGSILTFSFSIQNFELNGRPHKIVTANDVTKAKVIEEELRQTYVQLSGHLNNSPLGLVEYDKSLKVTQWSGRCEEIFEWSSEEILRNDITAFNLIYEEDLEKTGKVAEDLMSGRVSGNISFNRNNTKSGKVIDCVWYNSTVKNDLGEVTSVMSFVQDITESKKSQNHLMQSKKEMDLFFNNSLSGFFFMMMDEPIEWNDSTDKEAMLEYVFDHQRVTRINQAMLDQYGAREEDFIGLTPRDIFEHDVENSKKIWGDFFDKGKLKVDTDERRFDGTSFWVEGDYTVLYDEKDRIIGHFGVQHDVTERREASNRVQKSEQKFKSLFNHASDGIFITDARARIVDVNQSALKMTGYTAEEIKKLGILDLIEADDLPEMMQELLSGVHRMVERVATRKNGEKFLVEISSKLTEGGNIQAIVRDITERKEAEKALKERDQLLKEVGEIAKIGAWEFGINNYSKRNWSPEFLEIHDLTDDIPPNDESWLDLYTASSQEDIRNAILLAIKDRVPYDLEVQLQESGKWLRVIGQPVIEHGEVVKLKGTSQDVTAQKLAEKKILEEKDLSDNILNSLPGVFYLYNQEGKFYRWNDNFKTVTGYSDAEISVMHPIQFFHEDQHALLTEKISNVFISGEDNVEADFLLKNAQRVPYYFTGIAIQYNGETCLMGVGIDISEKVSAEQSLQKSHKQLTTAQEIAKLGYWEWNWDTHEIFWSDEMYKICGSPKENGPIPEEIFKTMIHPDDRQKVADDRKAITNDGTQRETEFRFLRDNGETCFLQSVSNITFDDNGRFVRAEGTLQDVTEAKKRELKLQHSYERFNLIAKATNDALFEWCPSSDKAWWSESHYLLFGFDPQDGLPTFEEWLVKIHPEDQVKVMDKLDQIQNKKATGWTDEIRYKVAPNEYGILLIRCFAFMAAPDEQLKIMGSFLDLTESKKAEEMVRMSNERYELISKVTNDAVWDWNIVHNTLLGNDQLYTFYGKNKTTDFLNDDSFFSRVHPDDVDGLKKSMSNALRNGRDSITEEYRFRHTDGTYRYILDRSYVMFDDHGIPVRMLGAMQDVTDQKKTEKELQQLSNRLILATTSASMGIFDWDIVNNKMVWNEYMFDMYEVPLGNFKHSYNDWIKSIHPRDVASFEARVKEAMKTGHFNEKFRVVWANHQIRHIEASAIVTMNDHGEPISMIGVSRDITESVTAEQKIAKAIINTQEEERYELGQELHDNIIQLLVASVMNLNHLQSLPEFEHQCIDKAHNYTDTAIHEIRKLSHRLAPSNMEETPLEDALNKLLQSINSNDQYHISFDAIIAPEVELSPLLKINIYRILQEQLNNIIKHSQASKLDFCFQANEFKVQMIIQDDGKGFSPKEAIEGIGLNNIKRRVEMFNGNMEINSQPGEGCQIIIEIPMSQ
ncbi:PAS domain S-box protein [Marinoscillum sp.]|uniref:PAS domain S-box protein n=1 Tax=Marinoscillum sp. TaxID=2024838 RepID=UPI003BAB275D